MGDEVAATTFTREDRQRYREKVKRCLDVFARMLAESRFDADRRSIGLERELNLSEQTVLTGALTSWLDALQAEALRKAGTHPQSLWRQIAVRFDADIAAVTRDQDGNVVAGSLTDAVETHDVWTFARNLRSDDPNWKLVETDEA